MKEVNVIDMPYCSAEGNEIQIGIGPMDLRIHACPGETNCYEIRIYECIYEDDKLVEEKNLFLTTVPLTKEEYDMAFESSYEDTEFIDDIDGLVSKRVARDIFSFFIQALGERDYINETIMSERYEAEWALYIKYLIQERLAGNPIASYHFGYEPKSNNENDSEE